jgi:hypothetical protein
MATHGNSRLDKTALVRLTTWGTGAAVALTLAALATISATGSQRASVAIAAFTGNEEPRQVAAARLAPRPADFENERRRLNEAIRLLAADRDSLLTRIGSIERNLDDITGSITRQSSASPPLPEVSSLQPGTARTAAEPSASAPAIAAAPATRPMERPPWLANAPEPWPSPSAGIEIAPAPTPPPPAQIAALPAPAEAPPAAPMAAPPATPAPSKTEFGVDIGSGSNLDELRALWDAAKTQHPRLLGGLRPIVVTRQNSRGGVDMRLIVGPLPNAGAAAKLCATLGAADVMCSTRPFDGQRLAGR